MQGNNDIFKFLRENWFLILFIGGIIVMWVRFEANLNTQERRLTLVEAEVKQSTAFNNDVRAQLAEIKVTLDFIRQAITKQ